MLKIVVYLLYTMVLAFWAIVTLSVITDNATVEVHTGGRVQSVQSVLSIREI